MSLKTLDDDLLDDLTVRHPDFRRSIRKALQNQREGKGISLAQTASVRRKPE
jgi:hypothetical protein